ncbi:hypothetical protein LGR54_07890 [Ancylobacter sp. Lp-2]|uniref:hypothetical protein n=1 Tax=Ancylobacter sp. Lp-2 TaxID=2881339 RepID=UPI001E2C765B|nr:hypothetical protein [Ancylobacter sp. Lp-2]MCB4768521.1 hypothetical protein [Ancylobacter sp. Lp-2]
MTDEDCNQPGGPNETAAYIEALVAELARIAAANRLHMLHYLLQMAREEAANVARRDNPAAGRSLR